MRRCAPRPARSTSSSRAASPHLLQRPVLCSPDPLSPPSPSPVAPHMIASAFVPLHPPVQLRRHDGRPRASSRLRPTRALAATPKPPKPPKPPVPPLTPAQWLSSSSVTSLSPTTPPAASWRDLPPAEPSALDAAPSTLQRLVRDLEQRIFYLGPVNRHKVLKAVQLATEAVGAPPRLVRYNLTVALIVADLQMDCDTLCAAVLTQVISRPGCTRRDVERHAGPDVLRILNFHNQLSTTIQLCAHSHFTEMSFSNLRELILVGAMEEPRAISLEVARAVLAIRTLDTLSDEQTKITIARRSMYLHAPLANQLGIWYAQGELEEHAFMYLQPESYHMVRRLVGERRRECQTTLAQNKEFLERILTKSPQVRSLVRSVTIKGRVKGLYSVYRKMTRSGKKVCEIYDLLALRVLVQPKRADDASEQAACHAVADVIREHYDTIEARAKDYIARPKRNGYRSLHLTVLSPESSTPLEIQIRTEKMHHVAEFGAAAHWIYKEHATKDSRSSSAAEENDASSRSRTASTCSSSETQSTDTDDSSLRSTIAELYKNKTTQTMVVKMKAADAHELTLSSDEQLNELASKRVALARWHGDGYDEIRRGYVTCMASAIRASRVIVAAAGQLYGLAVGSTLMDLAHGLGVATLGAIAVVNGSVAPLTQRLEMNDIVRFISALPEP
ncbi:GTP pyrophosphokinase [Gracilaria domingensis]|nr:GTP pyrophosphokinase [Gracilaria domingensis]